MRKIPHNRSQKEPVIFKKSVAEASDDILRHLAFDNSFRANIILTVISGKIIMANRAACKLLGYSKKELLTKTRADIFDINDSSFIKMLKQRTAEGHSAAFVKAIKKNGKPISCQITSAVFMDKDGIEKSITTIADISQNILEQKNIDTKKGKKVTKDIALVRSKQKEIDIKKEKIVADNIALAKSRQKEIDIKKEKIVADDIAQAKSAQKKIDNKKDKIVAADIAQAKSKQINIDIKKEKIVADDIILAKAKADAGLAENNEWIKQIAKTSYDVMWDWDIVTGHIYIGDSMEEVFGYKLENNTISFKELSEGILMKGQDITKKLMKVLASRKKNCDDS